MRIEPLMVCDTCGVVGPLDSWPRVMTPINGPSWPGPYYELVVACKCTHGRRWTPVYALPDELAATYKVGGWDALCAAIERMRHDGLIGGRVFGQRRRRKVLG